MVPFIFRRILMNEYDSYSINHRYLVVLVDNPVHRSDEAEGSSRCVSLSQNVVVVVCRRIVKVQRTCIITKLSAR